MACAQLHVPIFSCKHQGRHLILVIYVVCVATEEKSPKLGVNCCEHQGRVLVAMGCIHVRVAGEEEVAYLCVTIH